MKKRSLFILLITAAALLFVSYSFVISPFEKELDKRQVSAIEAESEALQLFYSENTRALSESFRLLSTSVLVADALLARISGKELQSEALQELAESFKFKTTVLYDYSGQKLWEAGLPAKKESLEEKDKSKFLEATDLSWERTELIFRSEIRLSGRVIGYLKAELGVDDMRSFETPWFVSDGKDFFASNLSGALSEKVKALHLSEEWKNFFLSSAKDGDLLVKNNSDLASFLILVPLMGERSLVVVKEKGSFASMTLLAILASGIILFLLISIYMIKVAVKDYRLVIEHIENSAIEGMSGKSNFVFTGIIDDLDENVVENLNSLLKERGAEIPEAGAGEVIGNLKKAHESLGEAIKDPESNAALSTDGVPLKATDQVELIYHNFLQLESENENPISVTFNVFQKKFDEKRKLLIDQHPESKEILFTVEKDPQGTLIKPYIIV